MKRNLILALLFFLTGGFAVCQSIDAIKKEYLLSLHNCVVLKNTNAILPLKNLDEIKIGYIESHFNSGQFYQHLRKYQLIHKIDYKSYLNNLWDKSTHVLLMDIDLERVSLHDLVIISAGIEKNNQKYIVFLSHITPASLPENLFSNASAIVASLGESSFNTLHAAQIIYGAEAGIGKLPFWLNKNFKTGYGMTTNSLNRLRYGPAELVGIPSTDFEYSLQLGMEDAIRNGAFPGANLLVAKDGIVIYHKAFGRLKFDKPEPVSEQHIYDLASITKIFSATLGSMKLHSDGLFNTETTLGTYWPYLRKSNKSNLVWKDVLAHRGRLVASITFYKNLFYPDHTYRHHTVKNKFTREYTHQISDSLFSSKKIPKKLLHEIKQTPLLANQNYVYSDLSMILLGKTIEEITKMPLNEYTTKNFYAPLGATETTFLPTNLFSKQEIVPTEMDLHFRKDLIQGYVHDENAALLGGVSGHAGLFSNANDMAKIAQMLLNGGEYGGKKYMSSETIKFYTKYHFAEMGNRRGLGFDKPLLTYDVNTAHTARDASPESYGHSGFTGTFIWMDPKYNLTYILLSNRVYPTRANNKISQLSIRPCIQQTIYDYILK